MEQYLWVARDPYSTAAQYKFFYAHHLEKRPLEGGSWQWINSADGCYLIGLCYADAEKHTTLKLEPGQYALVLGKISITVRQGVEIGAAQ